MQPQILLFSVVFEKKEKEKPERSVANNLYTCFVVEIVYNLKGVDDTNLPNYSRGQEFLVQAQYI